MAREPGYCLHKPTGLAYVKLGGRVHYLGRHGSTESRQKYDRLKAEWLINRHAPKFADGAYGTTMAEVCLAYLDHAKEYYRGGPEFRNMKSAILPISELYATLPAANLSPLEYEAIRRWWLNKPDGRKSINVEEHEDPTTIKKCSRQYINTQMKRLMRIVTWGVAKGMIPATVHQTLKCIDPLKRGRVSAPEAQSVTPVDDEIVEATLVHLTPVLADMVRVQRLLGCRPGELCGLTPAMFDRKENIWTITLSDHKTAFRGKSRIIYVGPKAQAILKKYLLRGPHDYLFSPAESERQRCAPSMPHASLL